MIVSPLDHHALWLTDDPEGFHYAIVVREDDGSRRLTDAEVASDLRDTVPFCAGMSEPVFTDGIAALRAAIGLTNAYCGATASVEIRR